MNNRLYLRCVAEMKEDFGVFCREHGFTPADCIRAFVREVIVEGHIPAEYFDMSIMADVEKMPKNDRIYVRVSEEERDSFQALCEGAQISDVLRNYIMRCLMQGKAKTE